MEIMTETNEMSLFIDILSDMICQYLDTHHPSILMESIPSIAQVQMDEVPKAA
ncbi:hypothetical protein [Paenibacillus odorifer]|uniref:hypothetical protein n=1 Tax=Paenibacillus odorifer TaxID=189426 RepID=UPI0015C3CBA2|nr:hypothetical protein [Paenibacillus odorifer]